MLITTISLHFFTEVGCYLFAQLAQSLPLCTYCWTNHRFATLCTFCWTQPFLCTSLHQFALLYTYLHFFALLCTSLRLSTEVCCYLFAQVAHSFTLSYSSPPHFVEHRTCVMQTSTEFVFVPNFMAKHYIQVFVEQEHISGKMHHSNWRSGTRAGQWLNLTWSALILIWASGGRPPLNCIMVRRSECPARIV